MQVQGYIAYNCTATILVELGLVEISEESNRSVQIDAGTRVGETVLLHFVLLG